jgi:hypothetical protein
MRFRNSERIRFQRNGAEPRSPSIGRQIPQRSASTCTPSERKPLLPLCLRHRGRRLSSSRTASGFLSLVPVSVRHSGQFVNGRGYKFGGSGNSNVIPGHRKWCHSRSSLAEERTVCHPFSSRSEPRNTLVSRTFVTGCLAQTQSDQLTHVFAGSLTDDMKPRDSSIPHPSFGPIPHMNEPVIRPFCDSNIETKPKSRPTMSNRLSRRSDAIRRRPVERGLREIAICNLMNSALTPRSLS